MKNQKIPKIEFIWDVQLLSFQGPFILRAHPIRLYCLSRASDGITRPSIASSSHQTPCWRQFGLVPPAISLTVYFCPFLCLYGHERIALCAIRERHVIKLCSAVRKRLQYRHHASNRNTYAGSPWHDSVIWIKKSQKVKSAAIWADKNRRQKDRCTVQLIK